MTREEAKDLFRKDKDSYGKPKAVMAKINAIYDAFEEKKLEKHKVCVDCLCVGISDPNCVCCYSKNYDVIELEFEVCQCGNLVTDGYPADTEFNKKQREDNKQV